MTQEQMKELEILREFQRVCQKYNLKYYAIGGTCLGAVRHKGFIPWDDDIDVAMPVEDYHEFFEVAPKELNSQYEVIGPYTMRHTYGLYNKIHDKETTFVETSVKNIWIVIRVYLLTFFQFRGCQNRRVREKR